MLTHYVRIYASLEKDQTFVKESQVADRLMEKMWEAHQRTA